MWIHLSGDFLRVIGTISIRFRCVKGNRNGALVEIIFVKGVICANLIKLIPL